MLGSRVAAAIGAARKANRGWPWGLYGRAMSQSQGSGTSQGVEPIPTDRPADPAIHSSELEGTDAEAVVKVAIALNPPPRTLPKNSDPLIKPPKPPHSTTRIDHTEVSPPAKPNTHQKHDLSIHQNIVVDCAGLDGSPWPFNSKIGEEGGQEQEEEDKEYFKHHKASPLSEVKFADTRKPIIRETNHTTGSPVVGYFGEDVGQVLWRKEQLDSAEEALGRASRIWMWNKMRGDPHSPHGRVLRALRDEFW